MSIIRNVHYTKCPLCEMSVIRNVRIRIVRIRNVRIRNVRQSESAYSTKSITDNEEKVDKLLVSSFSHLLS